MRDEEVRRATTAQLKTARELGARNRDALQWLTFSHLPPQLQPFSSISYRAAAELITAVLDCPELSRSLAALLNAKDEAVLAGIRTQTGSAGSIPRPQTVVDPPSLQTLTAPAGIDSPEKFGIPGESVHETGGRAEAERMRDRLPESD